ncbi:hypothetical protein X731_28925 [Mesorhizobium sp. L2C054A000]|nr:hypothetical protein X731_28925 [Mesorhizobium sp. L2C054A000]
MKDQVPGGTFRQVAFQVHDGTNISLFEVKVTCEHANWLAFRSA